MKSISSKQGYPASPGKLGFVIGGFYSSSRHLASRASGFDEVGDAVGSE